MAKKIIAYDLGTGGSKASLFDLDGACIATTFVSYETIYPNTGWHEQKPEDWWKAIVEGSHRLLAESRIPASDIECLAISGQSLGVIPIDKEGKLLREATPIWSDTRAARQVAAFFEGLELVEPGLVPCPRWRPDPDDAESARDMDEYCALGRK